MNRRLPFTTRLMLTLLLSAGSQYSGYGQELKIGQVLLDNGKISVRYSLLDEDINHRYTLRLYSSLDDFTQPLQNVSGDIGVNIPVGGNKQLVWNVGEEMGADFKGEIKLEIKGQLYIPFITLSDFGSYGSFKRGNEYAITWSGGRGDNVLVWDLYNAKDQKVYTFPQIPNVGSYELVFPEDVKPGKNYRFRISDSRNQDEVIYSSAFTINRKSPLGLKALAGAVVGVGAYLLIGSLQPEAETEDLVDPVGPPK